MFNKKTALAKLILLGESGVGKTSIARRLEGVGWIDKPNPTVGANLSSAFVTSPSGPLEFQMWDTAGQERYKSIVPMYYRDVHVAFVVYSVTEPATYEKAKDWISEVRSVSPHAVIMLLGNKCDERNEKEASSEDEQESVGVKTQEAQDFANKNKYLFTEISAKRNFGIQTALEWTAQVLAERGMCGLRSAGQASTEDVHHLEQTKHKEDRKRCCSSS